MTPGPAVQTEIELVVVAASLGGVRALLTLLDGIPRGFPAAIAIVQHQLASGSPTLLASLLRPRSRLPLAVVRDGMPLAPGRVFLARPDRHFEVTPRRTARLREGGLVQGVSSAADPLFMSAAAAYGQTLAAVVLTGTQQDGTVGAREVRRLGGMLLVQDPDEAEAPGMPRSALDACGADWILPLAQIGPVLCRLAARRG